MFVYVSIVSYILSFFFIFLPVLYVNYFKDFIFLPVLCLNPCQRIYHFDCCVCFNYFKDFLVLNFCLCCVSFVLLCVCFLNICLCCARSALAFQFLNYFCLFCFIIIFFRIFACVFAYIFVLLIFFFIFLPVLCQECAHPARGGHPSQSPQPEEK